MGFFTGEMTEEGEFVPSRLTDWAMPDKRAGAIINGVGEGKVRRTQPLFPLHGGEGHRRLKWWGRLWTTRLLLRTWRTGYHMALDMMHSRFRYRKVAKTKVEATAEAFTEQLKVLALAHDDVDIVGITLLKPDYLYEGETYLTDRYHWLVLLGRAMDYDEASKNLQGDFTPTVKQVFGGYEKSHRAAVDIANWIRSQGYNAEGHGGTETDPAKVVQAIPAAIAAGMGQLGKHGSMINDELGSAFRLADIETDMPLVPDAFRDIGSEEFCRNCQACTDICPAKAIRNDKQLVRGVEKWYVDFDKCAPFMSEHAGCALCLTVCPWSRPGVAPKLSAKMLKKKNRQKQAEQS